MVNVMTKARVLEKWSKDSTRKDGTPVTYYNVKIADPVNFSNDTVSVSKEVFDNVENGQDVCLYGRVDRYGQTTVLRFTEIFSSKKHFTW